MAGTGAGADCCTFGDLIIGIDVLVDAPDHCSRVYPARLPSRSSRRQFVFIFFAG
jgi:hypothetical protein